MNTERSYRAVARCPHCKKQLHIASIDFQLPPAADLSGDSQAQIEVTLHPDLNAPQEPAVPEDIRRTIHSALMAQWDANQWRRGPDQPEIDSALAWLDAQASQPWREMDDA